MSVQASLGIGPECYNCLFEWLVEEEGDISTDPLAVFCLAHDSANDLLSITGCGSSANVTDCIDATTLANNIESLCFPTSNSSTTLTTFSSAASSTASTHIIISATTPPETQTFQSTTLAESTPTSTTEPLSTSQAPTTTVKPATTLSTPPSTIPSTAPSTTPLTSPSKAPSTTSFISTLTQSPTTILSSTISVSAAGFTSSTSTYSPLPSYTGSGDLLRGYCKTPFFTLIPGPTADLYIGVVGCVNGKDDCCPFSVASTHATTTAETAAETVTITGTVTTESFVTITLGATSPTFISTSGTVANIGQNQAFPTPNQGSEATLNHCPDDYQTISSVCCPFNYLLWTTMLGGQTPCFSTVSNFLTPPPLPAPTTTSTISPLPTSTIINVVYAMAYPVKPSSSNLTLGAKAGVGTGMGVFAVVMVFAAALYFLRRRDRRKSSPLSSTGVQSTIDAPSQEWWNSRAGELHHTSLPSPPPGAFDHDSSAAHVSPPPSEPPSGNTNFYHPAMEQRATRRRLVPVSGSGAPLQGANFPLPLRHEMESYHTPVNYGLPPGELFGGHIEQRQELQDQNWNR